MICLWLTAKQSLSWHDQNCIISQVINIAPVATANIDATAIAASVAATLTAGATFEINSTKAINNNIKFLEKMN